MISRVASPVSSGQRSDDRRRAVVPIVCGFDRRLGVVGMETEDVIRHPLRIGRSVKNLAVILFENGEPGLEVARVIGNIGRQTDRGADPTRLSSARNSSRE